MQDRQSHRPATDCGVVRCKHPQIHQRQYARHQAFCSLQRHLEAGARHQASLNGDTLIACLPTRPNALPLGQCGVFDPQSQAAAPPQSCFVLRPVLNLELHLRNVMTAVGVLLVWHWERSAKIDQHRIVDRLSGSKCTNAASIVVHGNSNLKKTR